MRRRRIVWALIAAAATLGVGAAGGRSRPAAAAPAWMQVNAAQRRVTFKVTAADGGANGTLNFNGYSAGNLTVTVPAGWHVHIDFVNSGAGALPHSLEVIRAAGQLPPQGVAPAIPRAETRDLLPGIPPQQTDTLDFTAAPAGPYFWFCGVPSHGISGMWTRFVVSASAKAPEIATK